VEKRHVLPPIPALRPRANTITPQQLPGMPAPHRAGMDIAYTSDISGSQHVVYPLVMTHQLPFLSTYSFRDVLAAKPVEKYGVGRSIPENLLLDVVIMTLVGRHLPSPAIEDHDCIILEPDYRIDHFNTALY